MHPIFKITLIYVVASVSLFVLGIVILWLFDKLFNRFKF